MNNDLFPQNSTLIVQGCSNEKRYLLSFICTDDGLNTEQAMALKNYRNTVCEVKGNQQMALCVARLSIESCGGRFQLKTEKDRELRITIALPLRSRAGGEQAA